MICLWLGLIIACPNKPAPLDVTFCDAARPIKWHASDTRKTKEQADAHNKVGVALRCDWAIKK